MSLRPTLFRHPAVNPAAATSDPIVDRNRLIWTSGDFSKIAESFAPSAARFVERLGLRPGERVIDVACGTGNTTLPAARTGAVVRGLDIAAPLLDTARAAAARVGLAIEFDEGNAEALPYDDGSFDTAITMFGAMFAPRPDRAAAELLRVVRPGGRIVMANWTPSGFVGQMLKIHVAYAPPPPGLPSVLLWGADDVVRSRFEAGATEVVCRRQPLDFVFPVAPDGVVGLFETCYGPTVRTVAAIDPESRERFTTDLELLWASRNVATDGTTRVEADYLEVTVLKR